MGRQGPKFRILSLTGFERTSLQLGGSAGEGDIFIKGGGWCMKTRRYGARWKDGEKVDLLFWLVRIVRWHTEEEEW